MRDTIDRAAEDSSRRLKVAALFAGIGGIELGLKRAGHETRLLCEIDPAADAVLAHHFRNIERVRDVRDIERLPSEIGLVTAGFPCQDLSQAGETKGIGGQQSGLVSNVFRLLAANAVPWVLLENVPFMLQLNRGSAIKFIVKQLEALEYRWAYRVLDSRAFGLPQRRERVFLLASREADPAGLLFSEDRGRHLESDHAGCARGFYWTEGTRGLGWAIDAVPTLKGGSTLGIPSPPAIWMTDGRIVTPDIRDAERLQGFEAGWTMPAEALARASYRWKLIGNAVTVDVAEWVGKLLLRPPGIPPARAIPMDSGAWPKAAFGSNKGRFAVACSSWPIQRERPNLADFLRFPPKPLSAKATEGFLKRLKASRLKYPPEFAAALEEHLLRAEARSERKRNAA